MKTLSPVRFRWAASALTAASALLWGAVAQAQPTIFTNYPDGTVQFQAASALAFTVIDTIAITNITVTLNATNLYGTVSTTNLTAGKGLTVSGPTTSNTVTTPLTSNTMYGVVISVSDANGLTTNSYRFDTITPVYTWEAEDFDYNGGMYFDNPQIDSYAAAIGVQGVDANNNQGTGVGAAYRPSSTGNLGNEVNGDIPRTQFVTNAGTDYDVGWTAGGQFGNYTRTFPKGSYNVFMRGAVFSATAGVSDAITLMQVTSGVGTTNQALVPLGKFAPPSTGSWQTYTWTPLVDAGGNPVVISNSGSISTIRMQEDNGGWNANCFMLMAPNPNYTPKPYISSVSPNFATNLFVSATNITFTITSIPGITSSGVVIKLNGVTPTGVTYGGTSKAMTVTVPVAPNVIYNVSIGLTDTYGASTYAASFGTFSTNNYTWEAEDFDYNGGLFFDNPQVDQYAGLTNVYLVDGNNNQGGGAAYRPSAVGTGVLGNEVNGDIPRAQFTGTNVDYDVGWTAAGQFANYTRTYPKGTYNLWLRSAVNGGSVSDAITMSWLTTGLGTTNQTLSPIGRFNTPATGSWQTYTWTPLVDLNGNPVVVTNSGSVATLNMHEDNGGWNANFFMFAPVDTSRPVISGLYPNGQQLFQRTNSLSFNVSSLSPISQSSVLVTINGVLQQNLVFGGSSTNMTVSWPYLQNDTAYSASITVTTPNNDPAQVSFNFDTFSASYYTWEAEDYDYNGGSFFDNPQIDSYANLAGIPSQDVVNKTTGAGAAYRPADTGDLGNEVTGDVKRAQYITANTNDYDVGWTATGQWANYTRTYPKGSYNVWLRCASPNGNPDAISFSQVTAGLGTGTQTTNFLGRFNVPTTGGYQNWTWTELVDLTGNPVTVNASGSVSTYRMLEDNGGFNMNFFMLVPAGLRIGAAISGNTVTISFPTATGLSYQIQYKNKLTDPTWTNLGSPVAGTGGTLSVQDTVSGQTRFYRANY